MMVYVRLANVKVYERNDSQIHVNCFNAVYERKLSMLYAEFPIISAYIMRVVKRTQLSSVNGFGFI